MHMRLMQPNAINKALLIQFVKEVKKREKQQTAYRYVTKIKMIRTEE